MEYTFRTSYKMTVSSFTIYTNTKNPTALSEQIQLVD